MRTSKPISTISYNSPEFLKNLVERWRKVGLIEFGCWIKHYAENDEKKDHFHVLLRPARLVQTMDLENESCELDPDYPDKPLKMIGFRVSKETDWLLYSIHDPLYLREKGLERDYIYSFADLLTTDPDTLTDIISHCTDERNGKLEYRLLELINRGMSWGEVVQSGFVPIRQMQGAKLYYEAISGSVYRYRHNELKVKHTKEQIERTAARFSDFEQLNYEDTDLPFTT